MSATAPRKGSKWILCDNHAEMLRGWTRREIAKLFVEGGPYHYGPCHGGKCALWPGTDFYVADICYGKFWLDWAEPRAEAYDSPAQRIAAHRPTITEDVRLQYNSQCTCGWASSYHRTGDYSLEMAHEDFVEHLRSLGMTEAGEKVS